MEKLHVNLKYYGKTSCKSEIQAKISCKAKIIIAPILLVHMKYQNKQIYKCISGMMQYENYLFLF